MRMIKYLVFTFVIPLVILPTTFLFAQSDSWYGTPSGTGSTPQVDPSITEIHPNPEPVSKNQSTKTQSSEVQPMVTDTSFQSSGGILDVFKAGKKQEHLKFVSPGAGDTCRAGDDVPTEFALPAGLYPHTATDLNIVVEEVINRDHRLRKVTITDNHLSMHYVLPARIFGVIPVSYVLVVEGDAPTMTLHLVPPSWIGHAVTPESLVSESFRTNVPLHLTPQVLKQLDSLGQIERHAKLIEVVSQSMFQVNALPFASSLWICYIYPFLWILIPIGVLLLVYLWFVLRRYRHKRRVRHIVEYHTHQRANGDDDDDNTPPSAPRIGGGAQSLSWGDTKIIFESKDDAK